MKPFGLVLSAALGIAALGAASGPRASSVRLQDDEPDASEPDAEPPPDAGNEPNRPFPKCIDVHAYARYGAGAYDHIVHIDNGCDKDASCEIATDVSPEVVTTDVPAKDSRDVVTYRGSPSTVFHARVKCDLHD